MKKLFTFTLLSLFASLMFTGCTADKFDPILLLGKWQVVSQAELKNETWQVVRTVSNPTIFWEFFPYRQANDYSNSTVLISDPDGPINPGNHSYSYNSSTGKITYDTSSHMKVLTNTKSELSIEISAQTRITFKRM